MTRKIGINILFCACFALGVGRAVLASGDLPGLSDHDSSESNSFFIVGVNEVTCFSSGMESGDPTSLAGQDGAVEEESHENVDSSYYSFYRMGRDQFSRFILEDLPIAARPTAVLLWQFEVVESEEREVASRPRSGDRTFEQALRSTKSGKSCHQRLSKLRMRMKLKSKTKRKPKEFSRSRRGTRRNGHGKKFRCRQ